MLRERSAARWGGVRNRSAASNRQSAQRWRIRVTSMRSRCPSRSASQPVGRHRRSGTQEPEQHGESQRQHRHAHACHACAHPSRASNDRVGHGQGGTSQVLDDGRHLVMQGRRRPGPGNGGIVQRHCVRVRSHAPGVAVQAMHPDDSREEDEQAREPQGAVRRGPRPLASAHRFESKRRSAPARSACVGDAATVHDPARVPGHPPRRVPLAAVGVEAAVRPG